MCLQINYYSLRADKVITEHCDLLYVKGVGKRSHFWCYLRFRENQVLSSGCEQARAPPLGDMYAFFGTVYCFFGGMYVFFYVFEFFWVIKYKIYYFYYSTGKSKMWVTTKYFLELHVFSAQFSPRAAGRRRLPSA